MSQLLSNKKFFFKHIFLCGHWRNYNLIDTGMRQLNYKTSDLPKLISLPSNDGCRVDEISSL